MEGGAGYRRDRHNHDSPVGIVSGVAMRRTARRSSAGAFMRESSHVHRVRNRHERLPEWTAPHRPIPIHLATCRTTPARPRGNNANVKWNVADMDAIRVPPVPFEFTCELGPHFALHSPSNALARGSLAAWIPVRCGGDPLVGGLQARHGIFSTKHHERRVIYPVRHPHQPSVVSSLFRIVHGPAHPRALELVDSPATG